MSLLVILMLWALPQGPAAQESCDPDLAGRSRGSVFGYRQRGDRCEGLYNAPVGGDVLSLVSLTEAFGDFDLESGEPLLVQWSGPASGPVQLRAEGVRPELYYRMDVTRPAAPGGYEWPTDFLASRGIARGDLAVRGWVSRALGGIDRRVYLPLRVAQRGRAVTCGPLRVLLWPGVRLNTVHMSVRRMTAAGGPGDWLRRDEELGEPFYPAEAPIAVDLPALAPGIYWLRFVATPRHGEPAPAEYYLQVPPAAPDCAR